MVKQGVRILLISCAYLLVCALGYLGFTTYKSNLTGWFLPLTALAYGLSGPFLLLTNLKKEGVVRQETQDRSFWLGLPGFIVVFYASPLEYLYLSGVLHSPNTIWTQIVGLSLIFVSLSLFVWARSTLKGMYSGRIWVKTGHTLIQLGPYNIIRHPAYASFIIMCFGISIGYSSLISLLAVPLLLIPGLIYRINVEEKKLITEYSEQYIQYSRRTQRLLPRIW